MSKTYRSAPYTTRSSDNKSFREGAPTDRRKPDYRSARTDKSYRKGYDA